MKHIILICLLFIVFSCNYFDPKIIINNTTKGKTVDEIISNEISSGKIFDTIFLDIMFGMSENDYNNHLRKLLLENKIFEEKNTGFLSYEMVYNENNKFICQFNAEFYDDKLYELGISAKSINVYSNVKLNTMYIVSIYRDGYGFCDIEKKMELIDDCSKYIWIDGNRKITVMCGYEDTRIYYRDLILEKQIDKDKIHDTKLEREQSKKDI